MSTDLLAAGSTDAVPLPVPYLTVDPPTLRMLNVDPRELRDNPRNLRRDIGDLTDLTASMAVVGILCPLVVIPTGDVVPDADEAEAFQIIIGHRRKHAVIWSHLWVVRDVQDGVLGCAGSRGGGDYLRLSIADQRRFGCVCSGW